MKLKLKNRTIIDMDFCCICGHVITGHGHNPWPIDKRYGARCCDSCQSKVLEARMKQVKGENK